MITETKVRSVFHVGCAAKNGITRNYYPVICLKYITSIPEVVSKNIFVRSERTVRYVQTHTKKDTGANNLWTCICAHDTTKKTSCVNNVVKICVLNNHWKIAWRENTAKLPRIVIAVTHVKNVAKVTVQVPI